MILFYKSFTITAGQHTMSSRYRGTSYTVVPLSRLTRDDEIQILNFAEDPKFKNAPDISFIFHLFFSLIQHICIVHIRTK